MRRGLKNYWVHWTAVGVQLRGDFEVAKQCARDDEILWKVKPTDAEVTYVKTTNCGSWEQNGLSGYEIPAAEVAAILAGIAPTWAVVASTGSTGAQVVAPIEPVEIYLHILNVVVPGNVEQRSVISMGRSTLPGIATLGICSTGSTSSKSDDLIV
ncbi:hypothetical protein L2E82_03012 [Cichorium intybus]|uniref:Uncharacterized protein n=1 Tax=Cichorium intybus TaxID=13427 RepID=A0ACB9H3S5_CICIN|nr:hypothetical protein L2E82_03012 [Cichorium intybus]